MMRWLHLLTTRLMELAVPANKPVLEGYCTGVIVTRMNGECERKFHTMLYTGANGPDEKKRLLSWDLVVAPDKCLRTPMPNITSVAEIPIRTYIRVTKYSYMRNLALPLIYGLPSLEIYPSEWKICDLVYGCSRI